MAIKRIEYLNFSIKQEPELLTKLNAVAPYTYRCVHDLVRFILLQELNKLIEQYSINISETQPQSNVG